MKIVEVLAEVKTNIHLMMATDKFGLKSHTRIINLNIHGCIEIIKGEMVVI